jgi:hypothetical protein
MIIYFIQEPIIQQRWSLTMLKLMRLVIHSQLKHLEGVFQKDNNLLSHALLFVTKLNTLFFFIVN